MRPVRFTQSHGPYNPSEVAGFADEHAKHLVEKLKVATYVQAAPANVDTTAHGFSVPQIRELVATLDSFEELRALRASEAAHPKFEGGRAGALAAIEERVAELQAAQLQREQEEAASAEALRLQEEENARRAAEAGAPGAEGTEPPAGGQDGADGANKGTGTTEPGADAGT